MVEQEQGRSLGATELRTLIAVFGAALTAHREIINRLNVYPVPDGDTGTNMALTVSSVVEALDELDQRQTAAQANSAEAVTDGEAPAIIDAEPQAAGPGEAATAEGPDQLSTTCEAISRGSLMGARGNSGVILSQLLRGLCDVFVKSDGLDGPTFAAALDAAQKAAYGAVMKPVEGTILTVVRESAEAALTAADADGGLVAVLEAARDQGGDALERTPEMLPVLAEAGVVDAGGSGFLLFLDAALHVADGRPVPEPPEAVVAAAGVGSLADERPDAHIGEHDTRYEVMFLLDAPDAVIDTFKKEWDGLGDSIVVVGGDGLWNCHVHTNDIGAAIEAGITAGRPHRIRVSDLLEEVEEEKWVREAAVGDAPAVTEADPEPEPLEPVPTAVVAVSPGDGITNIFRSVGVQVTIRGGQTMNPSTAELVEAVERAPADEVVILPNNSNIIPVAEQVDANTAKRVVVVPTRGVSEAIAALVSYDPQSPAEDNAAAMGAAVSSVVSCELTRAVRDSSSDVGPIVEGDYLGLISGRIVSVDDGLSDAAIALLAEAVTDDHEIVSVIEGEGASPSVTQAMTDWLGEHFGDVIVEVHQGGQAHYPYYLGIE
jgi:DAK2 domain fusion protein YloV